MCLPIALFCCKTESKINLAGSRFTLNAESTYAPIDVEALAVVDVLQKVHYFVLGWRDLTICVDYKPLLKIVTDWSLNDMPNPRLHSFKRKEYNTDPQ